jgi:transposase
MSYIKGSCRDQITLFPEILDDYINDNNQVRFIDAFVKNLKVNEFTYSQTKSTGRLPHDPRDILKLYIYGYLNHIRSSRKLENETHRNVEVMWLLQKLTPDHKTIANFRKDNNKAIKQVFKEFTLKCKDLGLFGCELIAVDGSKFPAVNGNKNNLTKKQIDDKIKSIDNHIQEYFDELDKHDEEEADIEKPTKEELEKKIKSLLDLKNNYQEKQEYLEETGETQISTTDKDSRKMRVFSGGRDICYNIQMAADAKNNMIVDFEATNHENDLRELSNISIKAKEALNLDKIETLADTGYYSNVETKKCIDNGIIPYVPKPAGNNEINGYGKNKFKYDKESDKYICPEGEELIYRKTIKDKKGMYWKRYQCKNCDSCMNKAQCTENKSGRIIERWENEEIMEEMALRMKAEPEKFNKRKGIIEPIFGIIKRSMGQGYLLLKGLEKVNTEIALTALAYNMKRAINEIGMKKLIESVA